ncbi:hypothetical protein Tco_1491456 [Tanacetum coccineum]
METMAENVVAAVAEKRPPILEKGMYDSWKTRIWIYIKGRENGERLIDSIKNGPFEFKKEITISGVNGALDEKRTELTLQERKSKLYDEFDRFTSEPGESIHSYYWRYAKFINDMNIIHMTMTKIQVNTKFVNHLQPKWSRFVTAAKQAKDLHNVNFNLLYEFLKHNENVAKEVREMRQRLLTVFLFFSSSSLCKEKPNGKLIYNSILNGLYVRRMIPEPGDQDSEVPIAETFHEQTDEELTENKVKQMEADDQAIQTIHMGLPEDIYAAIDSCETA